MINSYFFKKTFRLLFNFISKYWVSFILLFAIFTLINQNFVINKFPFSLYKKQKILEENIEQNKLLAWQNSQKINDTNFINDENMEILESRARYRFGLIKDNEVYYQIK
jgi:cell division protein FtsB